MTSVPIAEEYIRVRGARVHNLRAIDVDVPRNQLVALTGVSGSGKSSLAFDTLFAEGQRRYLESLSTHSRRFLNPLERPDVDFIDGLPPTLTLEQRPGSARRRSTLATITDIYDYLRLLYARAGQAHCPHCRSPVVRQTAQQIVDRILSLDDRRRVMILAPIVRARKGAHREVTAQIVKSGFVRARVNGDVVDLAEMPQLDPRQSHNIEVVIDRVIVKPGIRSRLDESVGLALKHGNETCLISWQDGTDWQDQLYSSRYACPQCGENFDALEPRSFSFHSPYGACAECDGLGELTDNDPDSVAALCSICNGERLKPFARAVTFQGMTIGEFTSRTVAEALPIVERLLSSLESDFTEEAIPVLQRTLPDVSNRLRFLQRVGLGYVTLDRRARTLSIGEYQRARLAACLGSGLVGVCYILDEPTMGLHHRDVERLFDTLAELRDAGNSVVIVEHDPDVIRNVDHIIDLGPGAGAEGGYVVAVGSPAEIIANADSETGRYFTPRKSASPERSMEDVRYLTLRGARRHNLKDLTAEFPLGQLTCVTGVSGCGKTSLVCETLVPSVRHLLAGRDHPLVDCDDVAGAEEIDRLVEVDQSPIGRNSRSNPATITGIWDEVRNVFSRTRESRIRGFTARRFSFSSKQGRCADCHGLGMQKVEMQFLPDLEVVCPACQGARFNPATLSVRYRERTVDDVLRMRVNEALEFFENLPRLRSRLNSLHSVGLGYLTLGQSALHLSGGEAQRVKLAAELAKASELRTLFVLDEPTTGLHPADVERLIGVLRELVQAGNTVIAIDHQLDLIIASDWVIDMGPEGGAMGGQITEIGRPVEIARRAESATGCALRGRLGLGD